MTYWLLAYKLTQASEDSQHKYALAILDPEAKDNGLSKTEVLDHIYFGTDALTDFIQLRCQPDEVDLVNLEWQLGEGEIHAMKVSKDSAIKMGFKV